MPALHTVFVRLLFILAAAVVASIAMFILIHLSGDPLAGFLPPGSSPETAAAVRQELGLDRPFMVQLFDHVGRSLRGDFGTSWRTEQPALAVIVERLPATLGLMSAALLITVVVGGGLGLAAARWDGRWPGFLFNGFALMGQAIPAFWLGTLMILLFAVRWRLLPASGGEGLRAVVLPALTLAAFPVSLVARLLRAELLVAARQPYASVATGKGLPSRTVWMRHVLPNAALPALAYVGVQAGFLIGGAVVVESVFAWPGVGQLALQATTERDVPVVHAFVVVVAVFVGLVSLLVDGLAAALDPRLRVSPGRPGYGG